MHDTFEYLRPRTRIQIALWLCLQSFSGQRGGTFSESNSYTGSNESLWYKDTLLYLERLPDGTEALFLKISMRFRKGARQSARSVDVDNLPSLVFYDAGDPVRGIIGYFLALAFADNVFKTIRTIEDLAKTRIPSGQAIWKFDWKDSIGEMPVFQGIDSDGPTGKSMTYSSIKNLIIDLGHRAGYSENINMHAICRGFLNEVNAKYGTARRNQIAGHSGRMFEESYQSNISNIDGYAMMTGKDIRTGHTSVLQSMALHQCKDMPNVLPKKVKDEMLKENEEYREVNDRIHAISNVLKDENGKDSLRLERERLYKRKACHERQRLREYRKTWTSQKNILFDDSSAVVQQSSDFSVLRSFMPQRDRLADSLFKSSFIRDESGQQIQRDLLHLASTKSQPLYWPGEEPIDGKCPFNDCNLAIDRYLRLVAVTQSNHSQGS